MSRIASFTRPSAPIGGWAFTSGLGLASAVFAGLVAAATPDASAVTIVNYDGTAGIAGNTTANQLYPAATAANVNFGGGAATDRQAIRPFSATTPLVANSATYTGPSVYGAYESIVLDQTTGSALSEQLLREASASLVILRSNFAAPSGQTAAVSTFYMFDASPTGTFFDASSQLSFTTATLYTATTTGRWVVRDGDTYYISSATFAPAPAGAGSFTGGTATLSDPNASTTWAVYSPSTAAGTVLNFNQGAATFAPHVFTNVTGAGLYFENDSISNGGGAQMDVLKFSATGTVPEPACLGLLVVSAAGLLARRVRR